MSEAERRVRKLLQDWKNDPAHWANNKRRFHGYRTLRKDAKRAWRFYPRQYDIFIALSKYIEEIYRQYFKEEVIERMAKIDEIRFTKYGRPSRDNI